MTAPFLRQVASPRDTFCRPLRSATGEGGKAVAQHRTAAGVCHEARTVQQRLRTWAGRVMRRDYRRSGKSASPSSDKTSAKTRETTADLAREYRKRGLQPVPIPKGSKGPRDEGWPHLEVTEGNIDRLFTAGQNIGIQLGKRSGGLVDVDLDCAEGGGAGAAHPAIHTCGIRPEVETEVALFLHRPRRDGSQGTVQFKGPKQDMLVELRIGGGDKAAQTMAPGSVHPASGEDVRVG